MYARRASILANYNGADISEALTEYCKGFTFKDTDGGESDTVDITLMDRDGRWLGTWSPAKGDRLSGSIAVQYWDSQTDSRALDCGDMEVSQIGMSGPPTSVKISAVCAPVDTGFKDTDRSQTWESLTLRGIAKEIAERYSLALYYEAPEISISSVEQNDTPDSTFLNSLCEEYGLRMKIYSDKLVLFYKETYKAKDAIATIDSGDVKSWSYSTTLEGSYTGGQITYTDPDTGEEIAYTLGDDTRLLSCSGSPSDGADAELLVLAALNEANDEATTVSLTLRGSPGVVAACTVALTGFGTAIDGTYYVVQATHTVSSGYTTKLELQRADAGYGVSELAVTTVVEESDSTSNSSTTSTDSTETTNTTDTTYEAGQRVTLGSGSDIFSDSTTKYVFIQTSGAYYIYDSTIVNGRIQVTASADRVGKEPASVNAAGWVGLEDIAG